MEKLRKSFWLFILILVLIPQLLRADMNFFERLLFSNKEYAKEIEIEAYIVTENQICKAFCKPSETVIQLSNDELYNQKTYLFLRLRNIGKQRAWGTLFSRVPAYHNPISIEIPDLSNNKEYQFYVVFLGKTVSPAKPPGIPQISIEWNELYTK